MIIVLLADGFNEVETLKSIEQLRKNDVEVKTVSLCNKAVIGAYGIPVICDLTVDEVDLNEVCIAIFPDAPKNDAGTYLDPDSARFLNDLSNMRGSVSAIYKLSFALKNIDIIKETFAKTIDDIYAQKYSKIEEFLNSFASEEQDTSPSCNSEFCFDDEGEEPKFPTLDDETCDEKESSVPKYSFPCPELLAEAQKATDDGVVQAEIQENADKLLETLSSFGVSASIKGVDRGPRLTRYQLVPAKGVKVSTILNLQDEIALSLATSSIRIEAPIPGKSAIGIEIPNKSPSTFKLRELIEDENFKNAKSNSTVCIGCDVCGNGVFYDIANMPHLIIAGAPGMGKTVAIHCMLLSMLYKSTPDDLKLVLIDTKQESLYPYNDIPHLEMPLITDTDQAIKALMWANDEMARRYTLFESIKVRNIEAYNEAIASDPKQGKPLHRTVIVIDEFADLMLPNVNIVVERLVMSLAQKSKSTGIHLILGTHKPAVNILTGIIRTNIPSRLSCRLVSSVDSRIVLEHSGADKLLDRGDMLFAPLGSSKPYRVQGAFVSETEISAVLQYIKSNAGTAKYDQTVLNALDSYANIDNSTFEQETIDEEESERETTIASSRQLDEEQEKSEDAFECLSDQRFLDCVEYVIACNYARTGMLQRKFSIGYGKAARYLDLMEDFGIIGEPNGARPRDVIMTSEEWHEKLKKLPPKDD